MSEHTWLAILSVLVTIAIFFMGALLISFRNFKKDFKDKHKEYCESNEKDHAEIWERVNHHWHNGGGNVVIPTATVRP